MNYSGNKNESKIAIIGAGMTGLSVGKELKRKGYKHVTIYEKKDSVGGKVGIFDHENISYDTGAVFFSSSFTELVDEVRRHNIDTVKVEKRFQIAESKGNFNLDEYRSQYYCGRKILISLLSFAKLSVLNSKIRLPGLNNVSPELTLPMNLFLEQNPSLKPMFIPLKSMLVGMGYGFYEETPAIYYLKLLYPYFKGSIKEKLSSIFNLGYSAETYYFQNGYQRFLCEYSKDLDVRFSSNIKKINRNGSDNKICISINESTEYFDCIIIATPLNDALNFLDCSELEIKQFQRVKCYNYYSVQFDADFMSPGETFFYSEINTIDKTGEILLATSYKQNGIITAYLHLPSGKDTSYIEHKLKRLVESKNGTFNKIIHVTPNNYFPHVDWEELNSFFNELESLQGKNATFFASSIMNVETVFECLRYGQYICRKYF